MFSFGQVQTEDKKEWAKFYGNPLTGFSVALTDYGNPDILGYSASLMPYISFHTKNIFQKPTWYFHLGLGAAYYTKFFDSETNPTNKSVGGRFSWSFHAGIYRDIFRRKNSTWQLGIAWLHGSNDHTSLPNFGINSFNLSLRTLIFKNGLRPPNKTELVTDQIKPRKSYSLFFRVGYGLHELGGPSGPVDGPTYPILGLYTGVGKTIKRFIRIRAGIGYRYYESYYDYITNNQLSEFIDQPRWNSSNIYISAGAEMLMGHFTLDVELGTNLYKPFFKTFFDTFEDKSDFDRTLKSLLLQRLGLYYYLWDTTQNPSFNLGIGCHINANNGQADFTGFSLMTVSSF